MTIPTLLDIGTPLAVSATVTPARPGTVLVLERRVGDRWVELTQTQQGHAADVRFDDVHLLPGTQGVRVRVLATAAVPGVASAATVVNVLPPVAPDPAALGELPRLAITTDDGEEIRSKEVYSRVQMSLDGSRTTDPTGRSFGTQELPGRLRVRGNSTSWVQVKYPYKVKLDKKTSVLGMPASKDWVLLANFYDRSLTRNAAAFHVARRIGVPWAPRMHDVELWLNGDYRGVYQLGEGIEIEPDRVDLGAEELPADPSNGGFLLEADWNDDTDPYFVTRHAGRLNLKEGGFDEDDPDAYLAQVREQIEAFEEVLYGDDFTDPVRGYRPLVDLRSFADWYLVSELTKSVESNFNTSVWIKKPVGGRLAMGPPWDFDQSAGIMTRFGIEDPEGWYLHRGPLKPGVEQGPSMVKGPEGTWINRMLKDPAFRAVVQKRWALASPRLHAMVPELRAHSDRLQAAADRNFAPKSLGGAGMHIKHSMLDGEHIRLLHDSWRPHADDLVEWYRLRVEWLDRAVPTLGSDRLP